MTDKLRITSLILGFALVMAQIPWAYADSSVGRWAIAWLGIAILLWACPPSHIRWPGIAFLGLAAASLLWSPVPLNWVNAILNWGLLGGAFAIGVAGFSDEIFIGAGWGMAINSGIAFWQFLTWHPWMRPAPEGLFGNRDFLAEAALVIIIPLLWRRRWGLALMVVPALLLPMYRGVIIAAGVVAVCAIWRVSRKAALILILICITLVGLISLSDRKMITAGDRINIWEDTIAGLTPLGRGAGQFYNTFPEHATRENLAHVRTDHAHNDWLEILYELGPLGLCIAVWFAGSVLYTGLAAGVGSSGASYTFLAFCILGLFGFPLHNAVSAILGLIAAGGVYASSRDNRVLLAGEPAYA